MLDPIVRFQEVMARATAGAPFDPIALSLATSTPDGRPSCRIVLLHEGRILADGPKHEVLTAELLERAYGTPVRVAEIEGYYLAWPPGRA